VADVEIIASYNDLPAIEKFSKNVSVVTFEFENVPAQTAEAAARHSPVRPAGQVLHTTQHRLREKTFLAGAGLPVTPFRAVRTENDLSRAIEELGCPAVLKTAGFGYDGKGQVRISSPEDADGAWTSIGRVEAVLEKFIAFEREISVVASRGMDGSYADWGVMENAHRKHILDVTISPARIPPRLAQEARAITRTVLEKLAVVGVLCVEFFLESSGNLMINELAPRPHNSGHLSFDASLTSQFEQQLRAVCGLPLGSTDLVRPAAMANLLGDLWVHGEPDWAAACSIPNVKLHLYGKLEPRIGRKMGHLTALAGTAEEAQIAVLKARDTLVRPPA
jgi:5-(carboxyamino)imidazole ribonucleotide synthase